MSVATNSQSLSLPAQLYNTWEDPHEAAFYLCNLLTVLAVLYAVFAAVAFRGLEGVKKQKKEGMGMIEKAVNQFKVLKVISYLFVLD